jgi:tRNA(adenine34) deaminase
MSKIQSLNLKKADTLKKNSDHFWMNQALIEARKAEKVGEVPIGAVLIYKNKIIARGHNLSISKNDPTAHAEMVCIRRAAKRLQNYRLADTILYVTLEPCAMCAGALIWSRIQRVVFGCRDPKAGACGSLIDLSKVHKFNHLFEMTEGILEADCRKIIQDFFRKKRNKSA